MQKGEVMKKENRVGICMGFVWELYGLFWDLCGVLLLIFQTEKCYSVGMRKEALETIGKITEPTFTHPTTYLLPSFTHPLSTLCRPWFGKGMWYKETVRKRQVQE